MSNATMPPTAIGLGSASSMRIGVRRNLQAYLARVGLQPYFPQLAYETTYNLWKQADAQTGKLNWKERTWDAVRAFPNPLLFSYNRYYYTTRPDALRLGGIAQDDLSWQQASKHMALVLDDLHNHGVKAPWLLVDEAPHEGSPRWTQAQDYRILRLLSAAVYAGWTVGIACPSGSHVSYWAKRVRGIDRWLLNAKNPISDYRAGLRIARGDGGKKEVWLYNARDLSNLATQMKTYGAVGYLYWSIEAKSNPLAVIGLTAWGKLPAMDVLLAQLARVNDGTVRPN